MDIEIHYYVTFLLAKQLGLDTPTSYKIAYSSQYIDDNTSYYLIRDLKNNQTYRNIITQSYNLLLSNDVLESIYLAFHFIPELDNNLSSNSNCSSRVDNNYNKFNTIAGGSLARAMLRYALYSKNPYWIGIASHAFIDSWAHQNFTGTNDTFNSISPGVSYYEQNQLFTISKIGHMDALGYPDLVGKQWYDHRLRNCKINNNNRFKLAIEELLQEYSNSNNANQLKENSNFINKITKIWEINHNSISSRIENYNKLAYDSYKCQIIPYHHNLWLKEATSKSLINNYKILRKFKPISIIKRVWKSKNYKSSNWYQFQEAAKIHYHTINRKFKLWRKFSPLD